MFCGLSLMTAINLGCAGSKDEQIPVPKVEDDVMNKKVITSSYDAQINAGIRRDRTIYPYHFVTEEADLNDLGRDQIDALTADLTKRPVRVNVPKFDNDEELHEARVAVVRQRLVENGIGEDRIAIQDGLSGGPGLVTAVFVGALNDKGGEEETMWFYDSRNATLPGGGGNSGNSGSGNSGSGGSGSGGNGSSNYRR